MVREEGKEGDGLKCARAAPTAEVPPLLELGLRWTWGHVVWVELTWQGEGAGGTRCCQSQSASCGTGECVSVCKCVCGEGGVSMMLSACALPDLPRGVVMCHLRSW